MLDLEFTEDASCAQPGVDSELWFPGRETERNAVQAAQMAIAICRSCPVREECLVLAVKIAREQPGGLYGIWAGLHDYEIHRLAGRQRRVGVRLMRP
jgi:hypothetical protein